MACKYYIHVNDFKNLQSNVMTSQQFFTNFSCRFFRAPGGHVFMVSVLKGYFTLVFSSDIIWLDKKNKATGVKKTFWNQKNFSWWTNKEFQKVFKVEVVRSKCRMGKFCTQVRDLSFMGINWSRNCPCQKSTSWLFVFELVVEINFCRSWIL